MSEGNGRAGRPSKLTPAVHQIVVEAVGKGMPREMAAKLARISWRVLYRWLAIGRRSTEGPEYQLFQDIKHAEAACLDHCLTIINESAITHWQAAAWLAERRHRRHFGKESELSAKLESLVKEMEKARNAVLA